MRMDRVLRGLRILYAFSAFSGALILHSCGGSGQFVFAQTNAQPGFLQGQGQGYSSEAADRRDRAIENNAARIDALDERVSTIQGIGSGALGVLGVLQLMGLIASAKVIRGKES